MQLHLLFIILIFFILLSSFFSGSETGMMALNRYRLRHLARKNHRAATRVSSLLQQVDKLLGVILIGNTFANVLASAIATLIAARLFGEVGVLGATIILTLAILIFAEIIPKTIAATYPEKVAFFSSLPLKLLLKILYPVVWLANVIVTGILKVVGVKVKRTVLEPLTPDELRTVVSEASGRIATNHQEMLLTILDLEKRTVEDVMIPRSEIVGINISREWPEVLEQLVRTKHSNKVVYRDTLDNIQGVVHLTNIVELLAEKRLSKTSFLKTVQALSFIPLGTSLTSQLLNFRASGSHIALVVDEYGDIHGLISLADILQHIVGKFMLEIDTSAKIRPQTDGSFLVDGTVNIRELNKILSLELPTDGPKTVSGLIIEYLEAIPSTIVALRVAGYPMEVLEVEETTIKTVHVIPKLRKQ